jgi:hypothetical protein
MTQDEYDRLIQGREPPKANKYHAEIMEVDYIKFRSKKEARFYQDLKAEKHLGAVLYWHRQVAFDLPGNTRYIVDFQVFYKNGNVVYYDVKGRRLKEYIRNKKMVEALYPIKIIEA